MAGECEGVVMFADAWLIQQGQSTHNPCCDMHRLGEGIYSSSAGWAISADAGVRCTSFYCYCYCAKGYEYRRRRQVHVFLLLLRERL